jgi:hypothetical protein
MLQPISNTTGFVVSGLSFIMSLFVKKNDEIVIGINILNPVVFPSSVTDDSGNTYVFLSEPSSDVQFAALCRAKANQDSTITITVTLSAPATAIGAVQTYRGSKGEVDGSWFTRKFASNGTNRPIVSPIDFVNLGYSQLTDISSFWIAVIATVGSASIRSEMGMIRMQLVSNGLGIAIVDNTGAPNPADSIILSAAQGWICMPYELQAKPDDPTKTTNTYLVYRSGAGL